MLQYSGLQKPDGDVMNDAHRSYSAHNEKGMTGTRISSVHDYERDGWSQIHTCIQSYELHMRLTQETNSHILKLIDRL